VRAAGNHDPVGMISAFVRNNLIDATVADLYILDLNTILDACALSHRNTKVALDQTKRVHMVAGRVMHGAQQRLKFTGFGSVQKFAIDSHLSDFSVKRTNLERLLIIHGCIQRAAMDNFKRSVEALGDIQYQVIALNV